MKDKSRYVSKASYDNSVISLSALRYSLQTRRRVKTLETILITVALVLACLFIFPRKSWDKQLRKFDDNSAAGVLCQGLENEARARQTFVDISFEEATQDDILTGCEEDWVAFGRLPYVETGMSLGRTTFDAVVSWVNGSNPTFADIRKEYAITSKLNRPETTWLHDSRARHREWSQVQ